MRCYSYAVTIREEKTYEINVIGLDESDAVQTAYANKDSDRVRTTFSSKAIVIQTDKESSDDHVDT